MKKQKWDENADMRDLMRDINQVEELEKASRTGLTREQLKERRDNIIEKYNTNPNHLVTVKELAGIYEQLEDWHNAQTFYAWAHTLSAGDVALAAKASAMKDRAIEVDLKNLSTTAAADPDNLDLKAALDARRADRLAEQIQEAQRRVDQNPTDPQLRFDLGNALYNAGDYSAAIPHLQQATRNPHVRTRVLLLLGRTFKAKGMFDLSIKQLSDALANLHTMDHIKKEVLYEKGLIHQEMGDKTTALESSSKSTRSITATATSPTASNRPTPELPRQGARSIELLVGRLGSHHPILAQDPADHELPRIRAFGPRDSSQVVPYYVSNTPPAKSRSIALAWADPISQYPRSISRPSGSNAFDSSEAMPKHTQRAVVQQTDHCNTRPWQ